MTDQWARAITEITEQKKWQKIFLLGGPDAGKTTFGLALSGQIAKDNPVTLIDTDIGQSAIGPPAAVSSVLLTKAVTDISTLRQDSIHFVGDVTPVKFMLPLLAGTYRLSSKASAYQVFDTSGLVSFPFGYTLKFNKLMALKPDLVVAFQREDEMEPFLKIIRPYFEIITIKASPEIPRRSAARRAAYREQRFKAYFAGSKTLKLKKREISVFPPTDLNEKHINLTIGLNGSKDTLGLGLITAVSSSCLEVFTPVKGKIKGIVTGNLKISKDGKQLGRLRK